LARQWNVNKAYIMADMATRVKRPAEILPILSPKLSRPTARPPRMTVKFSHERKVRSLAKKTFGSTRVGRAILLPGIVLAGGVQETSWVIPGAVCRRGWEDMSLFAGTDSPNTVLSIEPYAGLEFFLMVGRE